MSNDAPTVGAAGDRLAVAVSWIVVGIPALWGVSQVVVKSLALFR
ncbi:MAG: hypothetical protein U0163_02845 [Gemmatimonadaceae bacterium]